MADESMTEEQSLEAWSMNGILTPGYIGYALRRYFNRTETTQQQARALLKLQGEQYDKFWLYLQAARIPRSDHFADDLAHILKHAQEQCKVNIEHLDLESLEYVIRNGSRQEAVFPYSDLPH